MMLWQALVNNLSLKLLALLLAVALWLLATGATDTKRELSVPLTMRNLSPELVVASPIPEFVDVTIAGPKIRILGLRSEEMSLVLDLGNLGAGTVTFGSMEKRLGIPPGISVLRVYPSVIDVELVRKSRRRKK